MTESQEGHQEKPSWGFEQGDEAAPGLFAMKMLGGGRNYEAYLVWSEKLSYLLVAKMLRPHLTEDRHALHGLVKEVGIVGRLNHPMVVRGFGADTKGERPHLLLEHLEGPSLSSLVRKGALPIEQTIPLAMNLCSALHYMHSEKVVHLDVKPSNIIMGLPPRLIDLSVARTFDAAKKISGHVGTDEYMAPEQCAPGDRGQIGAPADIWGLGATLFRAVTGKLPFKREKGASKSDELEVRFPQLVASRAPFPKNVPERIMEVIDECLRDEPDERPVASEVAAAIEPLVGELPRKPLLRRARPGMR